jgi:site-specific DNA recombinase
MKSNTLQTQREGIERWCAENHYNLKATFEDDGVSGERVSLTKRPGSRAMLSYIAQSGIKHIVVWRDDRWSRNTLDAKKVEKFLESKGVELHMININNGRPVQNYADRFYRGIVGEVAEMASGQASDRIRRNKEQRRRNGLTYSPAAFGTQHTPDGRVLADPEEVRVLRAINKLVDKHGKKWTHIAKTLNAWGVPAKKGGQWHAQTVKRAYLRGIPSNPQPSHD